MDAIALMSSAMHAAQTRLDVSAANLANVSSDGFHKHVSRTLLTENGVKVETSTESSQGPLRGTGRAFDLAVAGSGSLYVADRTGQTMATRGGSFVRDRAGHLVDERGRRLLGERGAVRVDPDATIDSRGIVRSGDRDSGHLKTAPGTEVQAGFLESANVDAVHEMIDVLGAQRAFESAQKVLSAVDQERQKDVDDVARVKS